MPVKKFGDWAKAGVILTELTTKLKPALEARLQENGELVLKTLRGHIEDQDLEWTPLKPRTIQLKSGEKVYIETGWLKDNLGIRKIKSSKDSTTIFIGASPWKKHKPSGLKFSDLMIYLEYGTTNGVPARPLIRPTMEELKGELKDEFLDVIRELIGGIK